MYFVKTHLCSPEPKIGERFYKFLNEFHSREVELMGGYKNGCLKGLEDELRDRNYMTSLVEGCVFAKQ